MQKKVANYKNNDKMKTEAIIKDAKTSEEIKRLMDSHEMLIEFNKDKELKVFKIQNTI